jgi:peroxiredoxin Q/BCP
MKVPSTVMLAFLLAAGALLAAGSSIAAEEPGESAGLKAGDPAPAFTLPGSDGKSHSLSDFAGSQAVVIAWFPKAFTGG